VQRNTRYVSVREYDSDVQRSTQSVIAGEYEPQVLSCLKVVLLQG